MRERPAGRRSAAGWRVSGATVAVLAVMVSAGSGVSMALPSARRAVAAVPIRIVHVHHEAAWLFGALVALTLVLLVEAALGAVVIARRRARRPPAADAGPEETAHLPSEPDLDPVVEPGDETRTARLRG